MFNKLPFSLLILLTAYMTNAIVGNQNKLQSQATINNNESLKVKKQLHCKCYPKKIAMTEPNQSDISVLVFANMAMLKAYSYDYKNHDKAFNSSSKFFTKKGWKAFLRALEKTKNMNEIIKRKLIVSAAATRAPIILQKGLRFGRFTWHVQIPLLVTYQAAMEYTQQYVMVTMIITRTSTCIQIVI